MNHHIRSNQMANLAHHQQLLQQQQRAVAAAAAAMMSQQQLLNHNVQHQTHHQQQQHHQRASSNNAGHHALPAQHHQHGRPPGRPTNTAPNHQQHFQQQQPHRNGPPNLQQQHHAQQQRQAQQQQQQRSHSQQQHHQPQQHHHHPTTAQQHHHHGEKSQPTAAPQTQAPAAAAPAPPQPPPLPQPLPKGWKREEVVRKKGLGAGVVDIVYYENAAPEKKFRSKLQLQRHFGEKHDMSLLDFRTGKLAQHVYKKHRRLKSIAAGNVSLASKYDVYLNVPTRQSASITKESVCHINNNVKYGNDATPTFVTDFQANSAQAIAANHISSQNQLAVLSRKSANASARPTQLFWELRFNALKSVDVNDIDSSLVKPLDLDLVNLSKFKNLNISSESALRSVAVSWYLNPNKLLLGQDKEFIKNPRVFIDRDQPLIPAITIKDEEIKQQEKKIKDIREKIRQTMSELENLEHDDELGEMADIVEEAETNDNGEVEEKKEGREVEEETTNETEDVDMDAVKVEPKEEPKVDDTKDEPNGVSAQ